MNWKLSLIAAASLVALVVIAPAISLAEGEEAAAAPEPAPVAAPLSPEDTLIEQGRYAAILGDCEACHTLPGREPFSGGVGLNTPFGKIYAANITPDERTGIGGWTQEQFRRAMRKGKDAHGRNLYPAFSYPYYTKATTADIDAIYAYLKTIPAVAFEPPKNELGFPFNMRFLLTFWNWLHLRTGEFQPDSAQSDEWNRGAYLVNSLGHCGACHTPKNMLGGDKNNRALEGGILDNWMASDLTGDLKTGLGGWAEDEIVEFLKTGINGKTSAYGSMIEVVRYSTSKMTDADLTAIAVYLKSLPAPKASKPAPAPDEAVMAKGKALYAKHCADCHTDDGSGAPYTYAVLAGNANVHAKDPTGLVRIILSGSKTGGLEPLSDDPMPDFAGKLNDEDLAAVTTYIRNSWGNAAPTVKPAQVAKVRAATGGADAAAH